jgi:hypothetical protein
MAQTGYTPISIYYSATTTNTPTAGNLVAGELAINTADGKLFYKDSSGVVQVIAGKGGAGVAGGSTTQVQYNSSGSLAGSANMTFNGTTLTLANDASISGLTVGKGASAVSTSTAVGYQGLNAQTAGPNDAFGYQSMLANTSGAYNVAFGYFALKANTTGFTNTAFGNQALSANTTASSNTGVGVAALLSNTTGGSNTAMGDSALRLNTTAANNSAFGGSALYSNTTGTSNAAVGFQSLYSNTTASNNTAVGYQAGYSNTTTPHNTFLGNVAGYNTITNGYNTFVGSYAGYSVTTGTQNTFLGVTTTGGYGAGYLVTTGSKNTIIGAYNGNQNSLDIRTSSNYIVLSDGDGNPRAYWNGSGTLQSTASAASDNAAYIVNSSATNPFGLQVSYSGAAPNNTTQRFLTCSDTVNDKLYIYSNGTVSNRTGTYNTISDAKLKENIVDATPKLDKLMDVKVRNYNLIGDELKQIGFVAQELETIFPALIDNVPDLDENRQPTGEVTKGVKLTVMIPILVKAIQELKAEVDSLKQQLGK